MSLARCAAFVLAVLFAAWPSTVRAQGQITSPAPHAAAAQPAPHSSTLALYALITQLESGSYTLVDDAGRVLSTRSSGGAPGHQISESALAAAIDAATLDAGQAVWLWEFFADRENSGAATPLIIKALAGVSAAPQTREALWSELASLARVAKSQGAAKAGSLLVLFETHRDELLPLLPPVHETEGAGDEMAYLMANSLVFGGDIWASVSDMVKRNPAAVARYIERQRERGQPVKWQYQGFEGLMQWRDTHFIAALRQAEPSAEALDAAGETFIRIFNSLHTLDDWFRVQMLKGLGPAELFNAAVSGEQQLYRLGTSGYRDFLHPIILKGIKESGTFEAFLARAAPQAAKTSDRNPATKRGLVFLRIASSFGLLDTVLDTVRDRDGFVSDAIAALGDPRSFESSSTIVVDLLTGLSATPQTTAFSRALLDRLYGLYDAEPDGARRSVYGSMLSAYQTVTDDRRNSAIDREFPLSQSMLQMPFSRLFQSARNERLVHRIFMRMHDDLDAERTLTGFKSVMKSLGAKARERGHHTVFEISAADRTVEIYVNDASAAGVRHGIAGIADALRGTGANTIVGRGHTGIITALQSDARRALGDSVRNVAAVFVGTCGSDASVREMIGTFGYVPFVTTKSSGHQAINDAIIATYITTLLTMKPGTTLSMPQLLNRALAPFLSERANEELREDAKLYRVNVATGLAVQLFDTHVRRHSDPQLRVAQ